jgi:hypothetical protein
LENNIKKSTDQLIPYQWFWTDIFGRRMSFIDIIKSRKFTFLYLAIIWGIIGILGFASTQIDNCDKSWQLAFSCDQAIWMIKMIDQPLIFARSLITAAFFHNGLDHILFVSIFGMLFPVQSFEVQHGWKPTAIIFLSTYVFIGIYSGLLFNIGIAYWPNNEFFIFGFERSWLGGSVGFYALIGAMAFQSRKKWVLIFLTACFEVINLTVIGIDVHITFIHIHCTFYGFFMSWWLTKKGTIKSI